MVSRSRLKDAGIGIAALAVAGISVCGLGQLYVRHKHNYQKRLQMLDQTVAIVARPTQSTGQDLERALCALDELVGNDGRGRINELIREAQYLKPPHINATNLLHVKELLEELRESEKDDDDDSGNILLLDCLVFATGVYGLKKLYGSAKSHS